MSTKTLWFPKTEPEIDLSIKAGSLHESHKFEAKSLLTQKNEEIAKDICSMTVDGGVLAYGLDEDDEGVVNKKTPISIKDVPEQIDQIAQTSIDEPPFIEIETVVSASDSSKGYIFVIIPPSPRSPHQVTVKGELRYYGRGATGNRRLTQPEVARLYERRKQWEREFLKELKHDAQNPPIDHHAGLVFLQMKAQLVTAEDTLLDSLGENLGTSFSPLRDVAKPTSNIMPAEGWSWTHFVENWTHEGADTYLASNSDQVQSLAGINELRVNSDGSTKFFTARVGESSEGRPKYVFERLVAAQAARFCVFMGSLCNATNYRGAVDIGIAVTGLKGAVSGAKSAEMIIDRPPEYKTDSYIKKSRVYARELQENPKKVASDLTRKLMIALAGNNFDPYGSDKKT